MPPRARRGLASGAFGPGPGSQFSITSEPGGLIDLGQWLTSTRSIDKLAAAAGQLSGATDEDSLTRAYNELAQRAILAGKGPRDIEEYGKALAPLSPALQGILGEAGQAQQTRQRLADLSAQQPEGEPTGEPQGEGVLSMLAKAAPGGVTPQRASLMSRLGLAPPRDIGEETRTAEGLIPKEEGGAKRRTRIVTGPTGQQLTVEQVEGTTGPVQANKNWTMVSQATREAYADLAAEAGVPADITQPPIPALLQQAHALTQRGINVTSDELADYASGAKPIDNRARMAGIDSDQTAKARLKARTDLLGAKTQITANIHTAGQKDLAEFTKQLGKGDVAPGNFTYYDKATGKKVPVPTKGEYEEARGRIARLGPTETQAYDLLATAQPNIDLMRQVVPELLKAAPGQVLPNALKIWAQRYGAGSSAAIQAFQTSQSFLKTMMSRAETGGSRPAVMLLGLISGQVPITTQNVGAATQALDQLEGEIKNRMASMLGNEQQPLKLPPGLPQQSGVMRRQSNSGKPIISKDGGKTWEYE